MKCPASCRRFCHRPTRWRTPMAVRHLHPGIAEAEMRIHGLTRGIRALVVGASYCDGRIAKHGDLHIPVVGEGILRRFRIGKTLSLVHHFPVLAGVGVLVGQQRGGQIGIIRLLRFQPLVFKCRNGFLGPPSSLLRLRRRKAEQRQQTKQTQSPSMFHGFPAHRYPIRVDLCDGSVQRHRPLATPGAVNAVTGEAGLRPYNT